MSEFISKSLEDTKKIATDFAKATTAKFDLDSNKAMVVGLYGDLGSGKTTFMKYFSEALGIKETIQSPTFVIMKKYRTLPPSPLSLARRGGRENTSSLGGGVLFHIDAYRLESGGELLKLGWQEIISDPQNIICIEWPDRVSEIMPPHLMIRFEHIYDQKSGENQRKISIA